jgi:hypothetical protein
MFSHFAMIFCSPYFEGVVADSNADFVSICTQFSGNNASLMLIIGR